MSTEEYSIGYADGKRDGYNEGVVDGHQAATTRHEAKIKALVEALHMYQKAGVGSSTDYPAQWTAYTTSLLAIEAAKETP